MSEEAVGGGCLGTSLKLNFPGRKCLLAYTHPCGCSANKDARLLRLAEEPCEEGLLLGSHTSNTNSASDAALALPSLYRASVLFPTRSSTEMNSTTAFRAWASGTAAS